MHQCIINWISIGADSGLSPVRHQVSIWTNADLLIGPWEQISVQFLLKKIPLKISSGKWWYYLSLNVLTHWGLVTHICVSKLSIIGSDNGLSPDRRQAIIWTNAGILLIGTLGTNFNEILIEIHTFSFKNIDLKMSSGKWRPFSLGLNVLTRSSSGPLF